MDSVAVGNGFGVVDGERWIGVLLAQGEAGFGGEGLKVKILDMVKVNNR